MQPPPSSRLRLALLSVLLLLAVPNTWMALDLPPLPWGTRWYRGALHVHSRISDGAASPMEMAEQYRAAGFQFMALTDHDRQPFEPGRDPTGALAFAGSGWPRGFLVIPGEEVSCAVRGRPVHLNVFNLPRRVGSLQFPSPLAAVQWTLGRVEALSLPGRRVVTQLNHPNFQAGVSAEDLLQMSEVTHLEVFNPHDGWQGDKSRPTTEQMWDLALADRYARPAGHPLFATAVDDAHRSQRGGIGGLLNGWVRVAASRLTPDAILEALEQGRFHASSGVELSRVEAGPEGLSLEIEARPGVTYRTTFVGAREGGAPGEVLERSGNAAPSYRFRGDELYVRARVESTDRHFLGSGRVQSAWTQPVPGPRCAWGP